MEYVYLGDRFTDTARRKTLCAAVRCNGKCIRRRASMLIMWEDGSFGVVLARLLRKIKPNI